MNTLFYLLTAVSALSSQLYSSPSCSGPGCRSNSTAGLAWFQPANRNAASHQYSLFSDSRQASGCQCRTCDPRFPCSPENCARQNCEDCVNGCQNCAPDQFTSQLHDGWEPRSPDMRRARSTPPITAQRICPVTGEELGSMGPPIPVTISGRTIQVCCDACVTAVRRNPRLYFERVSEELASASRRANPNTQEQLAPATQIHAQRLCPVTGEELGSMGRPIPVTVGGKSILVCCEGCVAAVKRNPAKYFAQVEYERNENSARPSASSRVSGPLLR